MSDHNLGDDDIQRLCATDPLRDTPDPDLTALRSRVMAEAAEAPAATGSPRRRAWLAGAGVAAAVGLLATGTLAGVALGRAGGGEVLALPDRPDSLPAINAAPGRATMAGEAAVDAKMMIWPGYGADVIADPGLADESGTADGYRLVTAGIDRLALAAQLAEAFGVKGTPNENEGMVTVGDTTGGGPQIWVYADATASWSFSNYSRDPWACASGGGTVTPEPQPMPADTASAPDARSSDPSAPAVSEPMPPATCSPSAKPLGEDEAREQAEAILTSLGVADDPTLGTGTDWETFTDGVITTATAWQTIDGQRTQLSWSIGFDSQGPIWANGFAGGLERVADYPIVGARTAVERSSQPRWAVFGPTPVDGVVMPMDATVKSSDTMSGAVGAAEPAPAATGAPAPSAPAVSTSDPGSIQIVWDPVVATGASLTLAQYWTPQGEFLLLPAYRLTTAADRGTWVVIAVAESAVTFTTGR